jgi:hypothetical protein
VKKHVITAVVGPNEAESAREKFGYGPCSHSSLVFI